MVDYKVDIFFRKMALNDIKEVVRIEKNSFTTPWPEASFMAELANHHSRPIVALAADELVGYACISCIIDEGHILTLAVRPEMRRRGIGRAITEYSLSELSAMGCSKCYLEVRRSNSAATGLYESLGFRESRIRKGYYTNPKEDALVMVLELP